MGAGLLLGCMSHEQQVSRSFERLYGCKNVTVKRLGGGAYEANGCGHEIAYRCEGERCAEDEQVTPIGEAPAAAPGQRTPSES